MAVVRHKYATKVDSAEVVVSANVKGSIKLEI